MGARLVVLAACSVVAACTGPPVGPTEPLGRASEPVRLLFVGDVMLGRNVAPVVASDPTSVFERLRPAVVAADLAFANLESPLTERPHLIGEYALEAHPAAAALLVGAGFDVLGLANNHATDAGPHTVDDSMDALAAAGLAWVGAGVDADDASAPLVVDVDGVRVGVLAYDMAGGTAATATSPGVARWDVEMAEDAVRRLRDQVDVLVVGLHGGVEYLTRPDPILGHATGLLTEWGADVVWGHGAHVSYPVAIVERPDRHAVAAPGLGNALFDQRWPRTLSGTVLEVLVDIDGVIALRTGRSTIDAGRVSFAGWDDPAGDAVALDGEWWTPVLQPVGDVAAEPIAGGLALDAWPGRLPVGAEEVARTAGDVTGTDTIDLVVTYRRPIRPEPAHAALTEIDWADDAGRSAHLAVYTAAGRLRWGSALMPHPVGPVTVCDGSMALAITPLDSAAVVAADAWFWDGFGFRTAGLLPGRTVVGCADVDGDGRSDPILTGRGPETSSN